MTSNRLSELDALRGLAILAVIYQHGYATAVGNAIVGTGVVSYPWLIANGWMGVGLFFVLSGFVLSLPNFREQRVFDRAGIARYAKARARRLLPLLLLGCLFGFFVFASRTGALPVGSLILASTTTNMFTAEQFFADVFPVSWSLNVEIWASAVLPLVVLGMKGKRWLYVFGALLALSLLVRLLGANVQFINMHINPLKDSVPARLDDFAVGIAVARLYAEGRLKMPRAPWALMGLLVLSFSGMMWDLIVLGHVARIWGAILNNVSQVGFVCLLMSALNSKGLASRVWNSWLLQVAGAMCFSLYTWHGFLMGGGLQASPFSFIQNVLFWLSLISLSLLTYKFVEFPNQDWRALLRLKKPATPALQS